MQLLIYPKTERRPEHPAMKKCAAFGSGFDANSDPVACPLYGWALVAEGACYEIQMAARGQGPDRWRQALVQEAGIDHLPNGSWPLDCLRHQFDTVSADESCTDEERDYVRSVLIDAQSSNTNRLTAYAPKSKQD